MTWTCLFIYRHVFGLEILNQDRRFWDALFSNDMLNLKIVTPKHLFKNSNMTSFIKLDISQHILESIVNGVSLNFDHIGLDIAYDLHD